MVQGHGQVNYMGVNGRLGKKNTIKEKLRKEKLRKGHVDNIDDNYITV
tara:strand:+ start:202 stop:345 length:144 start_codon:yes stop_codon:yes gene_type:complete